jgi:hypothetical protein
MLTDRDDWWQLRHQDGDDAGCRAPRTLRTVDAAAEYRTASEANNVDRLVDTLAPDAERGGP